MLSPLQKLLLVTQEHDYFRSELEGKKGPLTPPAPLANYHVSKELTKAKTAINILEEDLWVQPTLKTLKISLIFHGILMGILTAIIAFLKEPLKVK